MNVSVLLTIFCIVVFASSLIAGEVTEKKLKVGDSITADSFNEVTIDLTKVNPNIFVDRKFYGSQVSNFVPHPDPSVVDKLKLGKVRVGGNLFDTFNWKNGLIYIPGDVPKKGFSFENFTEYFRSLEIDPIIQINMLGMGLEAGQGEGVFRSGFDLKPLADAEFAGELVRHLNGELKLAVKDYSMGNEPEQWMDTHGDIFPLEEPLSADRYIERYVSYALAMRKAQAKISGNPNDIKLWGPEISDGYYDWQTGNMSNDCEYTEIRGQISCGYGSEREFDHFIPYFLHRLTQIEADPILNPERYKLLDYLSFHYYPNFRTDIQDANSILKDESGEQKIDQMLEHTEVWDNDNFVNTIDISSYTNFQPAILNRMNQWINENYPDARLALTEFAVDSFDTSFGYHPILRPLYMADLIGKLTRSGVAFFSRAFLSTQDPYKIPWVLIDSKRPTDLYKMYQLFTNNFKGNVIAVEEKSDPMLKSYALMETGAPENQKINLVVVNKSRESRPIAISIKMTNGEVKKVLSVEQPAWSASLYQFPSRGSEVRTLTFGASEMEIKVK